MTKPERIFLSSPHMGGTELNYIHEAFQTNWIAPLGANVDNFERDISEFTGVKHTAALASGTAAIHLSLILLGVKKGDEVLCSSFTFSASANPIVYQGATPVLIDSERDTWNMCPILLEEAIKDRIAKGKKPKACILVHLYGMPAKIEEILSICRTYDIPLIEDAAESIGATYKGQMTGSFGRFGVYSFNGNKIITTSGGGALVANSKEEIEKARFLATQARDNAPHYQHSEIGYNYRMSNILAGIGRGQMAVLNKRVETRRSINNWYRNQLEGVKGLSFQTEPSEDFKSNFWLTSIVLDSQSTEITRDEVIHSMASQNIECRPLWKPLHLQPVFEQYPSFINGTSEYLFDHGLCLPSGSNMNDKHFERIEKQLKKTLT